MPQDLTDDPSKFIQVMAWCRQAKYNNEEQHQHSLGWTNPNANPKPVFKLL